MQLYAFENDDNYVNAAWAEGGKNYKCPECGQILRVRGGPKMQRHYYHYKPVKFCNQAGKGEVHLKVQQRILQALPLDEAKMEVRFPEIGRIADVAWESERIVFEVQCAAMTAEEALARTVDYESVGWKVIWVLHDARYLQRFQTSLEMALVGVSHYYTNIDQRGSGEIYDCLNVWEEGRLLASSPLREVYFRKEEMLEGKNVPNILRYRMREWKVRLANDYVGLWLEEGKHPIWDEIASYHRHKLFRRLLDLVSKPYRLFFRALLESCCKRA